MISELMKKVEISGGCWNWTGSKNGIGYPVASINGVRKNCHRLFYEELVGNLPKELVIDHICRNISCVNPEHLEAVSNKENVLRGIGITAVNARKKFCKRGHPFDSKNTRIWYDKKGRRARRCITCSRYFRPSRLRSAPT